MSSTPSPLHFLYLDIVVIMVYLILLFVLVRTKPIGGREKRFLLGVCYAMLAGATGFLIVNIVMLFA